MGKARAITLIMCFMLLAQSRVSYSSGIDIYSIDSIKTRIIRKSINNGLDPHLALSLVQQESNFNKSAKSQVGAIGLFQLMPQTARDLGANPYYVDENIDAGIKYLKDMKEKFGSTELALAAYNAGPGAVKRYKGIPPYRETRNYVKRIMRSYKSYEKEPDPIVTSFYDRLENPILAPIASAIAPLPEKENKLIGFSLQRFVDFILFRTS